MEIRPTKLNRFSVLNFKSNSSPMVQCPPMRCSEKSDSMEDPNSCLLPKQGIIGKSCLVLSFAEIEGVWLAIEGLSGCDDYKKKRGLNSQQTRRLFPYFVHAIR